MRKTRSGNRRWKAAQHSGAGCKGDFRGGYMTVYLALVTGILLSLILTVVEGARRSTIRMHIECCADMALDSALAEYHREMLKQYELFFIDTSYGTGDPSFHRTEDHIRDYMEKNLRPREEFSIPLAKDITGLYTDEVRLLQAGLATDEDGEVLKYHVVQYMKDQSGLSLAEAILDRGGQAENWQGQDMEGEWDAAEEAMKEEIRYKKRLQDEDWDGEIPETPSDAVRATRGEGILGAAARGMQVSSAVIGNESRPSVRRLNQGTGLSEAKEPADGLLENGLLYAYILEKCGFFGAEKENSALSYEVEYILQQQTSDRENLKRTAQELLLIREAANVAFLFGSSLRNEAKAAAAAIALLLAVPDAAESIETVILFAWAYAESVKDIHILLCGDKVPILKTQETWNTPFSRLLTYRMHLDSYHAPASGWDYQDYLGALLFLHGADRAVMGLMDVMESDIQRTPGNSGFRMDGLIDGMEAEIYVTSSYGGTYNIKRTYEYE
ncbi:MAG: DUF5702 domain-containing protein [Eubacteriales bacterium]|nr:DUF5702 domain-containing protein [Eubacteriales bacterium]